MAKLIYLMNTSLDGYVTERDGSFDWGAPTPELYTTYNELMRPIGTHLYGRRLYEAMSVWDTAHLDPASAPFTPGLRELEGEFAQLWRGTEKIVFSSTLTSTSTSRTRIERTFDPEQVRQLKASSERDLTVGGPQLAAAMIAANLVDEIHVVVYPIIVGGGKAFLPPDVRVPLELVTERRIGRVIYMKYQRV